MFDIKVDEDIELKMLHIDDAKDIFKSIDSDREHLKKYLPWVDYTRTIEDINEFIRESKRKNANNDGFDAGIWLGDEFIGMIGFHSINKKIKAISIGYWLNKKHRGKGIMTYACEQFVRYAFNILKMNRVEIRCAEDNIKSRAIPERIGFRQEGVIRDGEILNGEYVNSVVYGILRRDKINKI